MENMSEFIKYVFKCTVDTFWAGIDASSNSKPSAVDIITGLVGMALVVFLLVSICCLILALVYQIKRKAIKRRKRKSPKEQTRIPDLHE